MAAMSAADFELDAIVWISSDEVVWRPGRVVPSSTTTAQQETISVELEACSEDDPAADLEVIQVRVGAPSGGFFKKKGPRLLRRNVALLGDGALKFDDLTEVPELHEAAVLHALDVRFAHGCIYTLTGAVLLAVNPFRTIPNLYSPEVLQSFLTGTGRSKSTPPRPHIFGTTSRALRGIREKHISQTILISGESGAGKTESTKFVMQFLALAGSVDPNQHRIGQQSMSRVEKQVLGSNPLLEAFGNAKTLRNDNSSRFGKFIELQFAPAAPPSGGFFADEGEQQAAPRLEGARIRTYLLEKVRVISQKDGERSFHIFYQALAAAKTPERLAAAGKPLMAATQEQVAQFHGIGIATRSGDDEVDLDGFVGFGLPSFSYLHRSGGRPGTLTGVNEADEFEATLSAMRTVGLSPQETSDIFHALAAVLHIGNIEFDSLDGGESSKVATGSETNSLEIASRLLGVGAQDLERALCKKTRQRNTDAKQVVESITTNLNAEKACETRDALARHTYQLIFSYIVARTNESIGYRERALYCGVLDIFGFEFFEQNSFEQLCINYTNELLQQFFNTFIFENEITLYKEEGISWKDLTFPDNCKIVDLLRTRNGIFPALDEECFILNGASKNWCNNMIKAHESHTNFSFVKQRPGEFIIQHFAGPVTYTAEGFLEKNKDELSRDVLQCLQGSRSPFVRQRFLEQDRAFGVNSSDGGSQKVLKAKRYTVSAEFREQLDDLMARIRETSPHFVRCIKSNPQNKPYVDDEPASVKLLETADDDVQRKPRFDRRAVVEQLSYQGVLEAIRVARSGYPVRFLHRDFVSDFRCLAGSDLQDRLKKALADTDEPGRTVSGNLTANLVQQLLDCREIKDLLEARQTVDVVGPIGWAVGKTRIFLKLDQFNFLKSAQVRVRHASATRIQTAWRCKVEFRNFNVFRKGMVRMQAKIRGALVRNRLWRKKREHSATSMEAGFRTFLARVQLKRMHNAAKAIQNFERRNRCRTQLLKIKARVTKLQRWWRSTVKRRRWRNLQKNVLLIQRVCRGALGRRIATDRLSRKRCLARVVRKLIRIRQKNLQYRAWREKTMQWYKQKKTIQPSFDHDALAAGTLKLWQKDQAQELEIAQLREANRHLEEQCESLGYYAWLRFRKFFNADPMPIPRS